jgi:hypothetical protein
MKTEPKTSNFDPAKQSDEQLSLPNDLWQGYADADAAITWRKLEEQGNATIALKIDLIGRIVTMKRQAGSKRFIEDACAELGDDDAVNTVQGLYKIFEVFRRPGGLSWSREKLAGVPYPRLRPFAQNADWTLKNPERVEALLNQVVERKDGKVYFLNENELRAAIKEALHAENSGKPERKFVSLRLSFIAAEGEEVERVISGIIRKHTLDGMAFSTKKELAYGEAVAIALNEWCWGEVVLGDPEDPNAETIANREFMPGGRFALVEAEEMQEAATAAAQTEKADLEAGKE